MMSISRNSVLAALERLLDEGYLVTKPSSGTYVADIIPDQLIQIQNDRQQAVYQSTQTLNINPHIANLLPHWHKQSFLTKKRKCFILVWAVWTYSPSTLGKIIRASMATVLLSTWTIP
jgi:GntR family transcriptional regulator/MocR family aminotransferase